MVETLLAATKEISAVYNAIKESSINPIKEIAEFSVSETPVQSLMNTIDNISVESLIAQNESARIPTRNEILEGGLHQETNIEFERKYIEINGIPKEVVVPKFESLFDYKLPDDMLKVNDKYQFTECNKKLNESLNNSPELKSKFNDIQLEQIKNYETPDGYIWHHDGGEVGKMQLVDTEIHSKTGHTGGRSIWGGGNENR